MFIGMGMHMKTIGLLGGMSWQSTVGYYQKINKLVAKRLGGLHSAQIVMRSVNFAPIAEMQKQEKWSEMASMLTEDARAVEKAGAQCLLICTNTMHLVADDIASSLTIPLLHIADATGKELQAASINKVALLGTRFTMQKDFYKKRIQRLFNIEVLVPEADDQVMINDVIYNELCLGTINPDSQQKYQQVIERLSLQGAQAVILGCTEIGLLLQQHNCALPLFDTSEIHARAAVEFALS